jgi:hypothetical protein
MTTKARQSTIESSEVKISYESNADTNAFTDAEKTKLGIIDPNPPAQDLNIRWGLLESVGSTTSISSLTTADSAITSLNYVEIAYIDSDHDELRVYKWNGDAWTQEGSGLPITTTDLVNGVLAPALTTMTPTTVVFIEAVDGALTTYSWNGSVWSQIGTPLVVGFDRPSIAALDSSTVVVYGTDIQELRTYSWNGSVWTQIGNGLSIPNINNKSSISALTSTDIAFLVSDGGSAVRIRRYTWDGTAWTQVGIDYLLVTSGEYSICALNDENILVTGNGFAGAFVFVWNGNTWEINSPFNQFSSFSPPDNFFMNERPSLTAVNGNELVMMDDSNDVLRRYRIPYFLGTQSQHINLVD